MVTKRVFGVVFVIAALWFGSQLFTANAGALGEPGRQGDFFVKLFLGENHSCALTDAGTLKCWGENSYGKLGDGTEDDRSSPVQVIGLVGDVQKVVAGAEHTCALMASGAVKCWGTNWAGSLGNGSNDYSTTPVDVTGLSPAIAVDAGAEFTCAVTDGGGVFCWGYNFDGQLGNGSTDYSNVPIQVTGIITGAVDVDIHTRHGCTLMEGGGLKCWGVNDAGQLGNGNDSTSKTPVNVLNLANAASVHLMNSSTCALSLDHKAWCWGWGALGQLGNGAFGPVSVPSEVTGLTGTLVMMATGGNHACVLNGGGEVWCWGYNDAGQLGNGNQSMSNVPVQAVTAAIPGDIISLSAGNRHTCVLNDLGSVYCVGGNASGQLGNGTEDDTLVFVPVGPGGEQQYLVYLPLVVR